MVQHTPKTLPMMNGIAGPHINSFLTAEDAKDAEET